MFCNKCGKKIKEIGKYCEFCGFKLNNKTLKNKNTEYKEINNTSEVKEKSYLQRLFNGRINRRNYIIGILLLYFLIFLIGAIDEIFSETTIYSSNFFGELYLVILFLFIFYGTSFSIRRVHDMGKNGKYLIWMIIPIMGFIVSLQTLFVSGENQENRFGSIPKPKIDIKDLLGFK